MENRHPLNLTYGLDRTTVPDDPYWLTTSQQLPTDRATAADVAMLVDALYDLNPCVDTAVTGTPSESTATSDPWRR